MRINLGRQDEWVTVALTLTGVALLFGSGVWRVGLLVLSNLLLVGVTAGLFRPSRRASAEHEVLIASVQLEADRALDLHPISRKASRRSLLRLVDHLTAQRDRA